MLGMGAYHRFNRGRDSASDESLVFPLFVAGIARREGHMLLGGVIDEEVPELVVSHAPPSASS